MKGIILLQGEFILEIDEGKYKRGGKEGTVNINESNVNKMHTAQHTCGFWYYEPVRGQFLLSSG